MSEENKVTNNNGETSPKNHEIEEIVEKIKVLVKKGNIAKIVIKKNGDTVLNLPLNAGIVGGIIGAMAAPWALIAATIATIGLKCEIELITDDGKTIDII